MAGKKRHPYYKWQEKNMHVVDAYAYVIADVHAQASTVAKRMKRYLKDHPEDLEIAKMCFDLEKKSASTRDLRGKWYKRAPKISKDEEYDDVKHEMSLRYFFNLHKLMVRLKEAKALIDEIEVDMALETLEGDEDDE